LIKISTFESKSFEYNFYHFVLHRIYYKCRVNALLYYFGTVGEVDFLHQLEVAGYKIAGNSKNAFAGYSKDLEKRPKKCPNPPIMPNINNTILCNY